jgi:hypothetical protein
MRTSALIALVLSLALLACSDDGSSAGTAAGGASAGSTSASSMNASTGATPTSSSSTGSGLPPTSCDPLPPPAGATVDVTPMDAPNLASIVSGAADGSTVSFADGTYPITATLQLTKPGVTLRSASNDASKVILDGAYGIDEIVAISASNVTLAHLTITRAVHHPVHVYPPGPGLDVLGTHLYAVHLVDGGQQFLKVNPIAGQTGWIDGGVVECSLFQMTDAGRPHVESCCGGCYTGGIDVHSARGWVVRQNRFEGIYCDGAGLAEHAIHFWKGSRDTLVEDNTIVDCARGVGFGLENGSGERVYADAPYGGAALAHYDGIIRNNVLYADNPYYDTGIEIDEAKSPRVLHNTILTGPNATGFFSSVDVRFDGTEATVTNNLVTRLTTRDNAVMLGSNNVEQAPLSDFVDAPNGDLHLAAGAADAVDKGAPLPDAGLDIDGDAHDHGPPDIGADER